MENDQVIEEIHSSYENIRKIIDNLDSIILNIESNSKISQTEFENQLLISEKLLNSISKEEEYISTNYQFLDKNNQKKYEVKFINEKQFIEFKIKDFYDRIKNIKIKNRFENFNKNDSFPKNKKDYDNELINRGEQLYDQINKRLKNTKYNVDLSKEKITEISKEINEQNHKLKEINMYMKETNSYLNKTKSEMKKLIIEINKDAFLKYLIIIAVIILVINLILYIILKVNAKTSTNTTANNTTNNNSTITNFTNEINTVINNSTNTTGNNTNNISLNFNTINFLNHYNITYNDIKDYFKINLIFDSSLLKANITSNKNKLNVLIIENKLDNEFNIYA